MTLSQADQNLAIINAKLMAKIALLEQKNQQPTEQYQQEKQQAEQLKQQFETQLATLYQQLQNAIDKQKHFIHKLFGQRSEKLTAKQNRLNQETALEDLASLEQLQDNFLNSLSDDEKANLQATLENTQTNDKPAQSAEGENCATAKPKRPKTPVIPNNLDIKIIRHDTDTTCLCGCHMRHIGDDVQDKLGIIPKRFYIQRHIYPKWVCGDCQTLVQAHTEPQVIQRSMATAELLAYILINKYADHFRAIVLQILTQIWLIFEQKFNN